MAALLKQLQKPKPGYREAVSQVLAAPEKGEHHRAASTPELHKDIEKTAQLLSKLSQDLSEDKADLNITESKETPLLQDDTQQRGSSRKKVVKRRSSQSSVSSPKKLSGDVPWWLTEGKKTSPQTELLIPEARRVLNEILPSDSKGEINLSAMIRQAVQLAAIKLRGDIRISEKDEDQAYDELLNLLTGKGPLQPLYDDQFVTDIFVDNHKAIRVVRQGQALETPFYFRNRDEYKGFVNGMLQSIGRVLSPTQPIVDCVLDDEWRSRVNAVDASLLDGKEPRLCIRIPRLQHITFYDILQTKTLPATLAAWLAELVASGKANLLILGPSGSGKTVMTTALLSSISSNERIITIEDVPEIFVPTAHLEKLVSRPANAQGEGEVRMPELLRTALRRSPHRIVVGEIRDEEGRLFLRALESGHAGSIATIHAETARESLWCLLDVVVAYESAPQPSILRRIARSVHLTITMGHVDGQPCLMQVCEVRPPVDGDFVVQPLVTFQGVVAGKRQWRIETRSSQWLDFIKQRGLELSVGPGLTEQVPEKPVEREDTSTKIDVPH